MKTEDRTAAARVLIDMPLFHLLMDELETAAVNGCVNAKHTDHETRAAFAAEVRAIRNFRGKLKLPIPMKPPLCSEMIAPPVSGMISPPV